MAPLAQLLETRDVCWWYASHGSSEPGSGEFLQHLSKSQTHRVNRSSLSRVAVDRVYFRMGLPAGALMNTGEARVAYSPDFTVPRPAGSRIAMTLHDLAWKIYPRLAPVGLRAFLDRVVPDQLARAAVVFTVSETTKADIQERFGIAENRIVIAPNAADDLFSHPAPGNTSAMADVLLPEDYLLMVGSIEPRKNHLSILKAIELVPNCPPLVIAGGGGWANEEIVKQIGISERKGAAMALGHVPDELLHCLYTGASAVVSASWYEGFSLPVLEGLAAGARVIASDIPAHREVAGPYAIYVAPGDVESIADGIIRALDLGRPLDDGKSRQQVWARRYSWNQSADRVRKALTELA